MNGQRVTETSIGRRRFLQAGLAGGAALAVPGLLSACSSSSTTSATSTTPASSGAIKRGGTMIAGFVGGGANETLDPQLATADIDFARGLNLFDRVTHFMPDLSVQNLLAESLEPNTAGTAWQIKLRSGVTFHDGKPLTADDVLYSYRRIISKNLIGASRLTSIDIANAKKTNDLTVVLPLKHPFADLPAMLAEVYLSIIPDGTTKFTQPNGTGPFKFESWSAGNSSLFSKNDNYFISGKPYLSTLKLVSIEDNTSRLQALQAGQIDAMVNVEFVQAKAHANDPAIKLVIADTDYVVPIYVRTDRAPFTDNRVREALRLAADRSQLLSDVYLNYGSLGNDLFGHGVPYYDTSIPQRPHDPEKAKALLKQAGHGDGLNITLYTSTAAPGMLQSAQVYAAQAKAAGINIKLFQTPANTYYSGQYYLKVAMGQTNYQGIIPVMWSDALLSTGPYNETAWKKPEFDKAFFQAEATQDEAKRQQIFNSLQEQLWNDGGYIIWGQNNTIDATLPNVHGVNPSKYYLLGGCDFKSFWIS